MSCLESIENLLDLLRNIKRNTVQHIEINFYRMINHTNMCDL